MTEFASYVDPLVGSVTLHLTIPQDDFDAIRADSAYREGLLGRVSAYAWQHSPGLLSHEWAHIMQVSAYPLLTLRSARLSRLVRGRLDALASIEVPVRVPLEASLTREWELSYLLEEVPVQLRVTDSGVLTELAKSWAPRRGFLSELDLIEEDATIFQYRIEIGSRGTGPGYRRWLAERTRYCALFYFLADLMNDDDQAMQLIPVICRVCFWTVRPLESLAAILADIVHHGPEIFYSEYSHDGRDEAAENLARMRLLRRFGIATPESLDFRIPALRDSQGVITAEQKSEIMQQAPYLVSSLFARWNSDDHMLDSVLRYPWKFFERRARSWDKRLDRYSPPFTIYVINAQGSNNHLVIAGSSDAMRREPALEGQLKMSHVLLEMLRHKYLIEASLKKDLPMPACPHVQCRFNSSALCGGWFPLPADPQWCEFPGWFMETSGRTVSADGLWLIKAEEKND